MGVGVAAMPNGGVAVVGITTSVAPVPFPTYNAYQPQNNGQSDYFVTVFNANGNLQYSTYLGGSGIEGGVNATAITLPMTEQRQLCRGGCEWSGLCYRHDHFLRASR